jgi:hypothetical protein
VADHGLDGGAAPQFTFDDAEDAALLTRDEDAARVLRAVAGSSLSGRSSRPGFHELTALLQRVAPSVGLFGLIAKPDGRYDGAWLTGIGGGENSGGLSLRTGGPDSYSKFSVF